MCGFAGEFMLTDALADARRVEAMAACLAHRGPDEAGLWSDPSGRCAIGFRRLSVIDLTASHQPMVAPDGSAVLAFNGEIYNFRALRTELAARGYAFRTQGDTEVLLALWAQARRETPGDTAAAVRRAGLAVLARLEGMFAFAIYDAARRRLVLARDRVGKKPLWLARLKDRVLFASEAKALRAHPLCPRAIDRQVVAYYVTLGYVPAPRSIWQGVEKLPPGHWLELSAEQPDAQPTRYWQPPTRTEAIGHDEAVDRVRSAVSTAVAKRMIADVPLGALLSGGIDSSIVVAEMVRSAGRAGGVKTFTAGFDEAGFDERPFARHVAARLGTDHHELPIRPADAVNLLDTLVRQYDEPFADSSALALYQVCQAARAQVTVALVGDGGDEAFCGYERYRALRLAETMKPGKFFAVSMAALLAGAIAPHDEKSRLRRFVRFASAMNEPPAEQYFRYRLLFGPEDLPRLLEKDFIESLDPAAPGQWFRDLYEQGDFDDEPSHAQRHDVLTYLPDDLLVKADIASMAHGLELRAPLLDHAVVELGLSLPVECKLRGRQGKAVLRDAFGAQLPPEVFARRKQGFGVPIDRWLKGELLPMLRSTLLGGPMVEQGWMPRSALEGLINDHVDGRGDHRHRLWALLWLGRWMMLNS